MTAFTVRQAVNWLIRHDYIYRKIDAPGEYLRFRQYDPHPNDRYYTQVLPNGVHLVIRGG